MEKQDRNSAEPDLRSLHTRRPQPRNMKRRLRGFINKAQVFYAEIPLRVRILAKFPIPESWSKKNKEKALKGEIKPNKKPDLDNIAKIILDGLNGVAYTDDKQVTSLEIEKAYSDTPCVVVYIAEDE